MKEKKYVLFGIALLFIFMINNTFAYYAGNDNEIHSINSCDFLTINVEANETIDEGEYWFYNCSLVNNNEWFCVCNESFNIVMGTKINTINKYEISVEYFYKNQIEDDKETKRRISYIYKYIYKNDTKNESNDIEESLNENVTNSTIVDNVINNNTIVNKSIENKTNESLNNGTFWDILNNSVVVKKNITIEPEKQQEDYTLTYIIIAALAGGIVLYFRIFYKRKQSILS